MHLHGTIQTFQIMKSPVELILKFQCNSSFTEKKLMTTN